MAFNEHDLGLLDGRGQQQTQATLAGSQALLDDAGDEDCDGGSDPGFATTAANNCP